MANLELSPEQLTWKPDSKSVAVDSTSDAKASRSLIGQQAARDALRFALASRAPDANIFVRGPEGSGRTTLVRTLLAESDARDSSASDFCYVHNFAHPDRPRLIRLPAGQGRNFQQAMTQISLFVRDRLPEILKNDPIRSRRDARKESAEREIRLKVAPLEKRLEEDGLALVRTQSGPSSRVAIYPRIMGKAVSPEEFRNLVTQNQAREEDRQRATEKIESWQSEVNKVAHAVNQIWQQALQHIDQINATETARILGEMTADVGRKFKAPGLDIFLREIIDDIVEKRIGRDTSHLAEPTLLYGVNVLTSRAGGGKAPVVFANQPSAASLFGTIDPAWMSSGRAVTSFRGIRTGDLLEADGGFLVLDAADLIDSPGSWRLLMRALRTGRAEVVPPELGWPYSAQSLKPEPIEVRARIILIGDQATWDQLMREDRDFRHRFNVLIDLEDSLPRDREGINDYVHFLARLADREQLPAFERGAILAIIEQGARQARRAERLSARFGPIADLAREAAAVAAEDGSRSVEAEHVTTAIKHRRERSRQPLLRLLRDIDHGASNLTVRGRIDGRINTVSTRVSGSIGQGMPLSLLGAVAPGGDRHWSLEGMSLSSAFPAMIGRLLNLDSPTGVNAWLEANQPLTDPDRGLELAQACCLLGLLANTPLRQDVAVIGAVDPRAAVRSVEAVNERIEAFYALCKHAGVSGQQTVVIPRANLGELMLESEVVKACTNDRFQVLAVDTVAQALEVATGARAGVWREGAFSDESLLGRARQRLLSFSD